MHFQPSIAFVQHAAQKELKASCSFRRKKDGMIRRSIILKAAVDLGKDLPDHAMTRWFATYCGHHLHVRQTFRSFNCDSFNR